MKKIECDGCGRKIDETYEYCPYCGTKRGDFKLMKYSEKVKNTNRVKKAAVFIGVLALAIIMVVLIAGNNKAGSIKITHNELVIPDSELSSHLPVLDGAEGDYEYGNNDNLYFYMYGDIYDEYVKLCKDEGFVVDAEYNEYSYDAYNDEGYRINIYHYDNELDVTFYNKIAFTENLLWPTNGLGALLPDPESSKLKITANGSDHFNAYVGDMSQADFMNYCSRCIDMGFDVDYYLYDDGFNGENSDGIRLNITFERNNTVMISMYE